MNKHAGARRTPHEKKLSTVILIVVLLAGLSLLLYPTMSEWYNAALQTRSVAGYVTEVAALDDEEYEEIWAEAREYNRTLLERASHQSLTDEEKAAYMDTLRVSTQSVMSYIEIPSIDCYLPIYHGTEDDVLESGVGHIEWSSLPVGGESTHCVLSSHRGLPSARLFTDLDQLVEGDTFMLRTLDEVLTYEVDQIRIVLPDELDDLAIVEGEDLCTLVTCTPYGVNSHRLLVRGHRVENAGEGIRVTADALQIEPKIVAPFVALPILLLLLLWLLWSTRESKEERRARKQAKKEAKEQKRSKKGRRRRKKPRHSA